MMQREFRLALRHRGEWLQPVAFYAVVILLFPLGASANDPRLSAFAPAILWTAVLLSALLNTDKLFKQDHEDGTLEQYLLSPTPVAWWVLKRLGAQWLITLLPLLLLSPLAALMLNLAGAALGVLLASLVLGTPVLVWLAGFAAALTVQVHRAGALLPLLVLPLMVPVLIFGTSAVRAAQAGQDPSAALLLLAAMSLGATTLMPFAIAGVLKGGR